MKRYRVEYLPEAIDALRSAFLYLLKESGAGRAGDWLADVYGSIDHLETTPRSTRDEGLFHGREFRSKLVHPHRVFLTIDEDDEVVYVVDVVHTARQTRLDKYAADE